MTRTGGDRFFTRVLVGVDGSRSLKRRRDVPRRVKVPPVSVCVRRRGTRGHRGLKSYPRPVPDEVGLRQGGKRTGETLSPDHRETSPETETRRDSRPRCQTNTDSPSTPDGEGGRKTPRRGSNSQFDCHSTHSVEPHRQVSRRGGVPWTPGLSR